MTEQEESLLEGLGRRCRRRRSDLQLMQKTVAAHLRMSPSAYSKLEKGLKLRISPEQIVALTQILQTSADYLLGLRGGERGEIPDDVWRQEGGNPATTQALLPGSG